MPLIIALPTGVSAHTCAAEMHLLGNQASDEASKKNLKTFAKVRRQGSIWQTFT